MTDPRPFRFGVTTASAGSRREWVERARRIEALGYSTMTIPDHFPDSLSTVPAVMAAADATERLRLGSWVFCNDFRHPALLYKDAATLDLLCDGRFELGIGAGWLKSEYEMAGIAFDPPAVRVARLEEAVQIVRGWPLRGRSISRASTTELPVSRGLRSQCRSRCRPSTSGAAEDLQRRRADYGFSYIVLNTNVEEQIDSFASVVALLAGQ